MPHLTDRLLSRRWGVFNHFLYGEPGSDPVTGRDTQDWNALVDNFDTEYVAKTLHEMGAGYYFVTLMQGRKYMIAPNAAFDRIGGTSPGEACSRRDLVLDLYKSLSRYDIDLCLYYTGDGPYKDVEVGKRFGFVEPRVESGVTRPFVENWAAVLREYSVRYGDKVKGWWIDGCYDLFRYNDELLSVYHDAIKAGNPGAWVAFNNGVYPDLRKWYQGEEITAGEFNDFVFIPDSRFVDGAQAFILAPLGIGDSENEWSRWRKPGARRSHTYMKEYIDKVNTAGGVVTVDIYIGADGRFDPEQVDTLRGI